MHIGTHIKKEKNGLTNLEQSDIIQICSKKGSVEKWKKQKKKNQEISIY